MKIKQKTMNKKNMNGEMPMALSVFYCTFIIYKVVHRETKSAREREIK